MDEREEGGGIGGRREGRKRNAAGFEGSCRISYGWKV